MKEALALLEILGGSRAIPPEWGRRPATGIAIGLWWTILILVALAFVGRTTKFIYVDF